MAGAGGGDARREVGVFAPVGREWIGALAPIKGEVVPSIGRQYGWNHGTLLREKGCGKADETVPTVVVAPARPPAIPLSCRRFGQQRAPYPGSYPSRELPQRRGKRGSMKSLQEPVNARFRRFWTRSSPARSAADNVQMQAECRWSAANAASAAGRQTPRPLPKP